MDVNKFVADLIDVEATDGASAVNIWAQLRRRYPYFGWASASLLSRGGECVASSRKQRLLEHIALTTTAEGYPDFRFTPDEHSLVDDLYPEEKLPEKMSTDSAIDKFLDRYGTDSPEESALLERLIFNPVPPDYASTLESQADVEPLSDNSDSEMLERIDSFIAAHTPRRDEPVATSEEVVHDDSSSEEQTSEISLAESLARIYIKQHQYQRAVEIITSLSLNNPEKSCYFADQIRFLKKLIAINNHKRPNKQK